MGVKMVLSFLLVIIVGASAMTHDQIPEIIQQVTSRDETPEIIEQVTSRVKTVPLTKYVDPLPQPVTIDSLSQFSFSITMGMYATKQKFHRDLNATTIFAYGTSAATAAFPGPTIVATRYSYTNVTWENHLPINHIFPVDNTIAAAKVPPNGGVPTVVHLHGGVVAPDSDGYALAWYTNNYATVGANFTRKSYYYPNEQHAGSLVYHDHAVGFTRINLLAGLLGAYIVKDPAFESPLNLPSGPQFDLLLVIADRQFNADGSLFLNLTGATALHPFWVPEFYGDAITVNGKIWPFLSVQRRKYRFRIINASNARYYDLAFTPTTGTSTTPFPFTVIGSDSSYLNAPVTVTHAVLSSAEAFDVVFDFSTVGAASEIELTNSAPYPYNNPAATPVVGTDLAKVMKFVIAPGTVVDPFKIPVTLANFQQALPTQATITRNLTLYEFLDSKNATMHLLINQKRFADLATETPKNGSTELWNVINLTGDDHPLHIHLAHFQSVGSSPVLNLAAFTTCMMQFNDTVKCNLQVGPAVPVPNHEKTWKNVVKLPPGHMTSVVVHFKMLDNGGWSSPYTFDPTAKPGYVYHCHILDHEDNEMIRPLVLTP